MSDTEVISTSFEPGAVPPRPARFRLCVPEIPATNGMYVKECLDTNWVSSAGPFVIALRAGARVDMSARSMRSRPSTEQPHCTWRSRCRRPAGRRSHGPRPDVHRSCKRHEIRRRMAGLHRRRTESLATSIRKRSVEFIDQQCQWSNGKLTNKTTGRESRNVAGPYPGPSL